MEAAITATTYMPPEEQALGSARIEIRDVELALGGHRLLTGANLNVRSGEIVLLRGENGSGKTTLLNVLGGFIPVDRGSIRLNLGSSWVDPLRETPETLARRGVGRLWQDIRLFPSMSVLNNVLAATPSLVGQNPFLALAAYPTVLRQERRARQLALENLDLVGMKQRASSSADMLSVGQMKRVALARLLQMQAKLWLLDEPLAGLDPHSSAALVKDLDRLRRTRDLAILVVEHQHNRLRSVADRVYVLRSGRIEIEGAASCLN